MALCTVADVQSLAIALLGDPTGKVFKAVDFNLAWPMAYRELISEMMKRQIPRTKVITTYTLPAGTTSLTPATAGITSMGELVLMEERLSGSSDLYFPMIEVDELSQFPQTSILREVTWREDTWYFIGATNDVQLRITYRQSGAAPTSGTIAIDDGLNFFAARTAAIMALFKGYDERAAQLDVEARGPRKDYRGGYANDLLAPMVRSLQRLDRIQPPAYDVESRRVRKQRMAPYIAAPVGSVTAITISGTKDGVNATFTLSSSPITIMLFLNGQKLAENVGYTRSGATITFASGYIPASGDTIEVVA